MSSIGNWLGAGILLWVVLLALVLAISLLNPDRSKRPIASAGLLSANTSTQRVAPERVLTIAVFPTIIVYYAFTALHADLSGSEPMLPDIPDYLLAMLTGSNSVYLAGKIARNGS